MNKLENKISIYKMRITSLIDEHAEALAQAQELYKELQDATKKIADLEEKLRERNVQKNSETAIVSKSVATAENQDEIPEMDIRTYSRDE
jgi:predicted  nucleic acid-binding Zn-ribbon protein